jgi:hypothetical protein
MKKEDLLSIIKNAAESQCSQLDLSNRDISEIPIEIIEVKNLKKLNLSYNQIKTIPKEIKNLKNLREVRLSRNEISILPDEISELKTLEILDISNNPIKKLPENFGNLSNLTSLHAEYCEISKLPTSFVNLLSLKKLSLYNNNTTFPPEKVIERGIYATMHYINAYIKGAKRSLINISIENLPIKLQKSFNEYIKLYYEIISDKNDENQYFNIIFSNPNIENTNLSNKNIDENILNFMKFVKENISMIKNSNAKDVFDLEIFELNKQISNLTESLTSKIEEINSIQNHIKYIADILKNKKEKTTE